jgi:hypothetical protein
MEVAGRGNVESSRIPFALNKYIYIYISVWSRRQGAKPAVVIQLEVIRRPPIILYRLYQPCPKSMPINRTRLCVCEDKLSISRIVKKKEKERRERKKK